MIDHRGPFPIAATIHRRPRGFSIIEVIVALTLIAIVSLVSWAYTAQVRHFSAVALGLIGEHSSTPQNRTARLRTIASEWMQAELEYIRQLGYEGLCTSASCTLYVPFTDCTGTAAQGAPLAEGPASPAQFPHGRIVVTWDPNTPVDASTAPATNYLQLVEVDLYDSDAGCQNQTPFLTGYTSVAIR
jgi:prepilin-type N-terminal cleavage/methylation domain-containing protein